ncbi:tRNA (N6-isopentenyl adenosine(37)-C2)-methylthiotransferase MiaB, partial [Pseudomonas sp. AH2 (2023)]|nr:tRNA (N6-isopentenyl adenosine(37)-C2)-methylthiotransferase MiaB [Pseudomonas sp. AH2 (2023)]
ILDRVRERIPHAAISTDIIVGFPGETDEDFEDTMRVVEQARFANAFTFQYSIREGTPAATMEDQVPKAVVQERYERLIALQERISLEE